jgi:hypothetical protein
MDSSNEIEDVKAAKKRRIKNKAPIKPPPGICPKAMGKVMKIKPGPSAADKPYLNTIGKIAKPAKIEARPSDREMIMDDFRIDEVRGIYAP